MPFSLSNSSAILVAFVANSVISRYSKTSPLIQLSQVL